MEPTQEEAAAAAVLAPGQGSLWAVPVGGTGPRAQSHEASTPLWPAADLKCACLCLLKY